MTRQCTFSSGPSDEQLNLSDILEKAVLQLRKEVPQELVVSMFQKLVRKSPAYTPYCLCTDGDPVFASYIIHTGREIDGHGH